MQNKKITSENHDNPAKTNELASAESTPAHGSRASADGIYAAAGVPASQDADGNTFPIPVDFFASFQIARPIPKAIRATAGIPANQYGMPTHQQRHSAAAAPAAAEEERKKSAQMLPRMPDLSRPKTAEMVDNLHYVQVQPQQPCNALHAPMPHLRAGGYNEGKAVSGAAQMQPINFQGLQPVNFLGFAPPMVDNNTAAAVLRGAPPPRVAATAAPHAWPVEGVAASQQALDRSAHALCPAPMLYDVATYWQGTGAASRTFSPKRPKGSQAAAALNTVALTPDDAALPYSAKQSRNGAAATEHIVPTEGPAGLYAAAAQNEVPTTYCQNQYPNAQWSNAPLYTTPSTIPVVYSGTVTKEQRRYSK